MEKIGRSSPGTREEREEKIDSSPYVQRWTAKEGEERLCSNTPTGDANRRSNNLSRRRGEVMLKHTHWRR
ncbi:hypothetical protein QN277_019079 [Acacia crassicarpa]|uniref:Uncharacterized protein n=1 Tax=Acacia crassicarpa TaxID=499986 RepID=A0AAE1JSM0_9FABA|nr:hypothetical protein QN277_019079 [Acacia crassicarpa]